MKFRIGLAMLGLAMVLLVVFFATYNPNATLKDAANSLSDSASSATGTAAATNQPTPDDVQKFLAAYNPVYLQLYELWQTRRYMALAHTGPIDAQQVAAAHHALLSFAGGEENIAAILRMRPLLKLPELQDRQLGVARRLAALRPATLPANQLDLLDKPVTDPEGMPKLFVARNRAAEALGYPSYLDLLADDLNQDAAAWVGQLQGILQADLPLYHLLHRYLAGVLATGRHLGSSDLIPSDWLGSGGPGTVDRALDALSARALGEDPSINGDPWSNALAFRTALALPALPDSFLSLQPVLMPGGSSGVHARLFSLDLSQRFWVLLTGPRDRNLYLPTVGALGSADLYLACDRPQLPPLLRGASCRAMGLAINHLYFLAARCALRSEDPNVSAKDPDYLAGQLLREAVGGPVLQIPLAVGAYLPWLRGMNRGVFQPPVVSEKFWTFAASQAKIAPPAQKLPEFALPAAAYGSDTEPADPLDEVQSWVLAHQLHRYICRHLLGQDLYSADYRGSIKVADFLLGIMRPGRGLNWERQLREATGEELDPGAMLEYYQPLADWLASH